MVHTEKGMADSDHRGGILAAYKAEKVCSDRFVSSFWSELVQRYQGIGG